MSAADDLSSVLRVPIGDDALRDSQVNEPTTTIGVTGQRRRWSVHAWGAVTPCQDGESAAGSIDWVIAAQDRWHIPKKEPTIRQRRLKGAPVVETRVQVPNGEAVQRVWAVPDSGGTVLVEFENSSSLPLAVALCGEDIVTERPISTFPIQDIELPAGAFVLPIGHRSTVRVALGSVQSVPTVPSSSSVVRGWKGLADRASRLVLPDPVIGENVVAARCDLLLEGPVDPNTDPVGFLLDVGELVRCGDAAEPWLIEMIEPTERLLEPVRRRRLRRSRPDDILARESLDAIEATRAVASAAGDHRAATDSDHILINLPESDGEPPMSLTEMRRARRTTESHASTGRFVRRIERQFVDRGQLLPGGFLQAWLGADFEVHDLPTILGSSIGFAVRWHSKRPAILWEQQGQPVRLTAPAVDPAWHTDNPRGEALWEAPSEAAGVHRSIAPKGQVRGR